jgi:hypothetical protein
MQDLAEAMDVTFQVSEGVYSLEMPTAGGRTQVVNAMTQESGLEGETILFYTPVGQVIQDLDWMALLELNVGTIYAGSASSRIMSSLSRAKCSTRQM